jgi:hypothetical protein
MVKQTSSIHAQGGVLANGLLKNKKCYYMYFFLVKWNENLYLFTKKTNIRKIWSLMSCKSWSYIGVGQHMNYIYLLSEEVILPTGFSILQLLLGNAFYMTMRREKLYHDRRLMKHLYQIRIAIQDFIIMAEPIKFDDKATIILFAGLRIFFLNMRCRR